MQAYLSEAVADVGNALTGVAYAMKRAVENTEGMKERALAIEKARPVENAAGD